MLESCTDNTYNSIAVSASDNPPVLSGNLAHGGIALLWKRTLDDYISPLKTLVLIVLWEFDAIFPIRACYLS